MKRILALILAILMLSGCQLASQEKREDQLQDKLVGVFVTFEHLDLEFDMEGWLNDHAWELEDGEEIVLDYGEGMEYNGKLYARVTDQGWDFPGHEGVILGQMWDVDHWKGFATEGIQDIVTRVNSTDTLDGIQEEGTIYVPADTKDFIFYYNPVYMSADGTYYAVQGDSFHSESGVYGMSQSVKCELKETSNGKETVYSAEYTVHVEGVARAEQVVLVQMSADHMELDRAEYLPDQMPESVTPATDAAYLIVEEYADGEVTRTLCQPGGDPIQVFCQEEHVYCLPRFTEILWES